MTTIGKYIAVSLLLGLGSPIAHAQMIQTTVPLQSLGSSFQENASVDFAIRGPNGFFNLGGGPIAPPFGFAGAPPAGGLTLGTQWQSGGVSGRLGLRLGQSSQQSISSTSASVTTMDGFPGSMSAGVIRPFVTGFTPVVGQYQQALAPLQQTANAIGQQRQSQYESLRQSQATLQQRRLATYLRRAQQGESKGNLRMARANYRSAIAIAAEPLRSQLMLHLRQLGKQPAKRP